MKKILLTIFLILFILGCTSNKPRYNNLDVCKPKLIVNEDSGMLKHKTYKVDIPAKTSIRIRGALIRTTGEGDYGYVNIFNDNEVALFGNGLSIQGISITGNNSIQKKAVIFNGENSYELKEGNIIGFNELVVKYDEKDSKLIKTDTFPQEDIFISTNKDIKIINYPYIDSSMIVSFWLKNESSEPQSVYYNFFVKDTIGEIGKNIGLYFLGLFFGNTDEKETEKETKINYAELYQLVSTALNDENIEEKIKTMEAYYARKFIKENVKNILEKHFGELSNGYDKIVNYFVTVYTDIFIYSNPYFFITE